MREGVSGEASTDRRVAPGRAQLPDARQELLPEGPLVVAVSGGLDSVVLLHWLRFPEDRAADLTVAHLDHAMRPGSAEDAAWVRGLCRSWGLPVTSRRLTRSPVGEEGARDARYAFLEEVRSSVGGQAIVTAHHADDQAETILFRILRGTGIRGLQGMAPVQGRIVRPLLDVWREELERYAVQTGLSWREDASNRDLDLARNAIRARILPEAESLVTAGARRSLVRLGANAAAARAELAALDALVVEPLLHTEGAPPDARGGATPVVGTPSTPAFRIEVDEAALAALDPALRRRVLRAGARRLGVSLSHDATRQALEALEQLQRGRGVDLTGGLRLERGGDRWILHLPYTDSHTQAGPASCGGQEEAVPDVLRIHQLASGDDGGSATLAIQGRRYSVRWSRAGSGDPGEPAGAPFGFSAELSRQAFPLSLRGWHPGDRIRLPYGGKAVAKLLAEAGVSSLDRPAVPVLSDAQGHILWVPGLATAHEGEGKPLRGTADAGPSIPIHLSCEPAGP